MKKTFVNPEMNISLFEMENILTVSGGENMTAAEGALNTAGANSANITKIDFKDINFTL